MKIIISLLGLALLISSINSIEERHFLTKLNHFDPFSSEYFTNRYAFDDEFSTEGGPIMIIIGDNSQIFYPMFVENGLFRDITNELNGTIFQIEHRFFGESFPTSDLSLEKIQYLSADQYIEDIRIFIAHIRSEFPNLTNSKVILTGVTNGPAIPLWFTQKHPDLVDGIWVPNGNVLAKFDFDDAAVVVGDNIREFGSDDCYNWHAEMFETIERKLDNNEQESIETDFNLCDPIGDHPNEGGFLIWGLYYSVASEVIPRSSSVVDYCSSIAPNGNRSAYDMLAEHIRNTSQTCFNIGYQFYIDFNREDQLTDISVAAGVRQRLYIQCSTSGWFMTSTSDKEHPFGGRVTAQIFADICNEVFETNFTLEEFQFNIDTTVNEIYGGKSPNVTNAIFTTPAQSPFTSLQISEDLSETARGILIEGATINSELSSISDDDSPELRAAKELVRELIINWVRN